MIVPSIHPSEISKENYYPYIFNIKSWLDGWNLNETLSEAVLPTQLDEDSCLVIKSPQQYDFQFRLDVLKPMLYGNVRRKELSFQVILGGTSIKILLEVDAVDEFAKSIGIVSGKWLIFCPSNRVNDVWSRIAAATTHGFLGHSSAVRRRTGKDDEYVVNVNTYSYFDFNDMLRVRENLDELGFEGRRCYKPDVYTLLDFYYGDHAIRPCRYRM